jgi:peptidoglycan L-alanyl-D-glutamate endopeptidase CwlK
MPIAPDPISLQRIAKLHPDVRAEVQAIALGLWQGDVYLRITHGLRTWEEQAVLYAIGRTTRGRIVTKAKAGQSYHNYGLAIDFCVLTPQKRASWNRDEDFNGDAVADYIHVVVAVKYKGWEMGGDWTSFKDYPHLQKTFGHKVSELRAKSSNGIITYPQLA